jgi:hypothetical protein
VPIEEYKKQSIAAILTSFSLHQQHSWHK